MTKTLILASFINKDKIIWFKNHLKNNFNISSDKLFFYDIIDDESKIVITFKLDVEVGERLDIKKHFNNTLPIHKKGSTLYTINALNNLIKLEHGLYGDNIDYKKYKIDWVNYENTFILNNSNELVLMALKPAFY